MGSLVERIDAIVARHHLLKHPFYQAWCEGTLPLAALRDYAVQYYKHVQAFPTYLSALHSRCEDEELRAILLQNLMDEEAGNPNHLKLWLQFAEGLGLEPQQVKNEPAWPEAHHLVQTFRTICQNEPLPAGIACLYAYESQIPQIAQSKIQGLKEHYGIDNPKATAYFQVHIEADVEHAQAERTLLEGFACDKPMVTRAEMAAASALQALWRLLSAVGSRHGIPA